MLNADIQYLLQQAYNGEFSPLREVAKTMTAQEFAKETGCEIRDWGYPTPVYDAVNVNGVDYLWQKKNGEFDGWDWCCCGKSVK